MTYVPCRKSGVRLAMRTPVYQTNAFKTQPFSGCSLYLNNPNSSAALIVAAPSGKVSLRIEGSGQKPRVRFVVLESLRWGKTVNGKVHACTLSPCGR